MPQSSTFKVSVNDSAGVSAGRTPADTPQEELKRQALRTQEQLNKLNSIIDNVGEELDFIAITVGRYNEQFKYRINNLTENIHNYKPIAAKVYNELADTMLEFSNTFNENIEYASENVHSLSDIIDSLNS